MHCTVLASWLDTGVDNLLHRIVDPERRIGRVRSFAIAEKHSHYAIAVVGGDYTLIVLNDLSGAM